MRTRAAGALWPHAPLGCAGRVRSRADLEGAIRSARRTAPASSPHEPSSPREQSPPPPPIPSRAGRDVRVARVRALRPSLAVSAAHPHPPPSGLVDLPQVLRTIKHLCMGEAAHMDELQRAKAIPHLVALLRLCAPGRPHASNAHPAGRTPRTLGARRLRARTHRGPVARAPPRGLRILTARAGPDALAGGTPGSMTRSTPRCATSASTRSTCSARSIGHARRRRPSTARCRSCKTSSSR